MKLLVLVMAALALCVVAAPIEIESADVTEVAEPLDVRQNWCNHPGISCW